MAAYTAELQQLHSAFSHADSGLTSSGTAVAEAILRNAENLVEELQVDNEMLAGDKGVIVVFVIDTK